MLLLVGGYALVRGASAIAKDLGVSPVIIGLTIVAFGTSAPELMVAVTSALKDQPGIAFGNIVGANIINIALILGLTAAIRPLLVDETIITREIPMLLLAMSATLVLALDQFLDGSTNRLARGDGLILCLLFLMFIYYTAMALFRQKNDTFVENAKKIGKNQNIRATTISAALFITGIAGLAFGGDMLVEAAIEIAQRFKVTPATIGLTVVAVGTTLPELTTSLIAALRGDADLAVGNVVGSNIFNILLVLGVATTITPIDVPIRGPVSLGIGLVLSLTLLILINIGKRSIPRSAGFFLLISFAAYMLFMFYGW